MRTFVLLALFCSLLPLPQVQPQALAQAAAQAQTADHRVVFVAPDDTLNVRQGPGRDNAVVGTLAPDARGVRITGAAQPVGPASWSPVAFGNLTGWCNNLFLTTDVPAATFCAAAEPAQILARFKDAVRRQDGALLASLVHPGRPLGVFLDSGSTGVWLDKDRLPGVFTESNRTQWGQEAGSGEPVEGTFAQAILPLLNRDLLAATKEDCVIPLPEDAPGDAFQTMGLPHGCTGVNYYRLLRIPGPTENELDWGAWTVGVEQWDGGYALRCIAHDKWEP